MSSAEMKFIACPNRASWIVIGIRVVGLCIALAFAKYPPVSFTTVMKDPELHHGLVHQATEKIGRIRGRENLWNCFMELMSV